VKTYTLKVVVEPDGDGFHAFCPALRHLGAVTQGSTEAEALRNINEVVQMIVDELREDGLPFPAASKDDVEIFEGARVAVSKSSVRIGAGLRLFKNSEPLNIRLCPTSLLFDDGAKRFRNEGCVRSMKGHGNTPAVGMLIPAVASSATLPH
jgi:predicted RNase H-like HicB family nuclease